ncbi:unnamed protein product [Diatraea saccharalis]|uniref:Cadherin domain-containing protein n=1 Tax=Diatraea saccharalis TaxID=40085 RepID=A0A9N9R0J4_9NEOP|nr:unnamed protein product [Diatraea saccharalis]
MMGVKYLAALLLLAVVASVNAQVEDHCAFMVAIPRPPTPQLPEFDFDGLKWEDRPLLPPPVREEVCMGLYLRQGNVGQQVIYMEEEIEGDVIVAKLNYQGEAQPTIGVNFIQGFSDLLGAEIRRIPELDNHWYLVITERQDYEIQMMQLYQFLIQVPGETVQAGVTLVIVNIDDNPPIIHALEPCVVPELGDARLTECVYEVTDRDGEISTRFMTFEVLSERNDNEIFYMKGEYNSADWQTMTMTVGITRPLDFETNRLHSFTVVARDSLPNNDTVSMLVRVENVEHRPPRWVEIFAVQQFDEKTEQNFIVRAIDADIEIDKRIDYYLITDPEDTFFSIKPNDDELGGATLFVAPIDRDTLERELFRLTIVAHKYDNRSLATEANVIIIVNDINDQRPEPLRKEYRTQIEEETPVTLNFGRDFGFHDRDLGENAQYTVELRDVFPPGAASAFAISPDEGYQRQTFIMSTVNHTMLDYEVPEFQNIILELVATDKNNSEFVGVATLYIDLINWNDELPIFEETAYHVTFQETVEKDFFVGTVLATDRDIDDKVVHSLMGNAGDLLRIDEESGNIYVKVDDAFDYHRQNILFVQIRADDTLITLDRSTHTTTTQLVIQLEDVNNTPPTLRLPRASPSVEENVPEGYVVEENLRATDPDTTAHLVFEINWDESWATKQGRPTHEDEYHDCVTIKTEYVDGNMGSAIGIIEVREIRPNVTIDFEEFEVLYLSIRVRDLNTVYGDDYDEAIFTVNIIDMNDNAPIFSEGTLDQSMRVREVSATGTVIGSVLATDIDGPLYNNVHYSIQPINDTPDGLVKIDLISGQLTVDADEAIDADVPPRHYLYYEVTASDRCLEEECPPDPMYFNTTGYMKIEILDTNNKFPEEQTDLFRTVVPVWENVTSGYEIEQIFASDLDRDDLYHQVRYQINYAWNPRLRAFFDIDLDTGMLFVNYTTDEVLDRDRGEPTHTIFVNLIDNFFTAGDGRRNQNTTTIEIILLDVNDNAPELPDDLSWSISEGLLEGELVDPIIFAPDIDEPGTDNSRVGYSVLNMTTTRDIDLPILFDTYLIEREDGNRARLRTTQALRGYWGTHMVHIKAFDHGEEPLHTDMWCPVEIRPYNFHDPVFVFPRPGATIRFARERSMANNLLITADGNVLERLSATDEDGLHAGSVTFSIFGDAAAIEHFTITNDGENSATLLLSKVPDDDVTEFQITIRATDGGTEPHSRHTDSTIRALFVTTLGEPIFDEDSITVPFTEGPIGLEESHQLPLAEDPKNYGCTDDCNDIFYRIAGGTTSEYFHLDPVNNLLSLARELDQEQLRTHTIVIAASNSPTGSGTPLDGTTLTVIVNVIEVNPRPVFERKLYTAGISVLDTIQRELLTVQAHHSLGDTITYAIDMDSMEMDSSLSAVAGAAFLLHPSTGVLTLNMQPTANMHGMFQFDVIATDTANETGRARVQIFLISTQNRVVFVFDNTLDEVVNYTDFIAEIFSAAFQMTCNIDQVLPASDDNGIATDKTEVRAHFIRDNLPVPAEEIEPLRSDTLLLQQIQMRLNERSLVLQDLSTGPGSIVDNAAQITVYVLAALSALLAFLCIVILITFICKTRALNRRMKAMSLTKFGSVDSGLNRMGLAPGTNKHTAEGSNPIYNETIKAPDFDAISDMSNDSDLIGIEDLPQFGNDYFPPGDNNSQQGIIADQV